ncbi:hypothetical protein predicted by Glimmer/Critica [Acetobacter ghanensis]|uniref:Uncharacterized protein n=1 Tax=Acetobacter ghanensis TaxID=431306 RepID=A0A0U5BFB4_9PROT|nr:hypothetical protein predicted by Glimmer/Critica [Acetobacter ghanensis]
MRSQGRWYAVPAGVLGECVGVFGLALWPPNPHIFVDTPQAWHAGIDDPGKATAFPTTWRLGGAAASHHAVRGAVCHSVLSRCLPWF